MPVGRRRLPADDAGEKNRRESGRGVSVYSRRRRYKCGRSDRTAVRAATVAAEHDDKSRELYEQLVEVENLIGDSGRELRCYLDSLSFEPEQFYETESRLNQINHLKVKYGDSAEAILQHKADDEERLLILKIMMNI